MRANLILFCLMLLSAKLLAADEDHLLIHNLTSHDLIFSDQTDINADTASRLITQGFSVADVQALVLNLHNKPFWTHSALYRRTGEFSDDYTVIKPSENFPTLAFTGATSAWRLGGDITEATRITNDEDLSTTIYTLHNTRLSIHNKVRSNCNDTNVTYPVEAELTLELNNQLYPLAKGYYDDIATNQNANGEPISCANFIAQMQSEQAYASVAFVGDLNGDKLPDIIVGFTEKGCRTTALYLGHQEKHHVALRLISANDVCGC